MLINSKVETRQREENGGAAKERPTPLACRRKDRQERAQTKVSFETGDIQQRHKRAIKQQDGQWQMQRGGGGKLHYVAGRARPELALMVVKRIDTNSCTAENDREGGVAVKAKGRGTRGYGSSEK